MKKKSFLVRFKNSYLDVKNPPERDPSPKLSDYTALNTEWYRVQHGEEVFQRKVDNFRFFLNSYNKNYKIYHLITITQAIWLNRYIKRKYRKTKDILIRILTSTWFWGLAAVVASYLFR